jgi:hypothetical protein
MAISTDDLPGTSRVATVFVEERQEAPPPPPPPPQAEGVVISRRTIGLVSGLIIGGLLAGLFFVSSNAGSEAKALTARAEKAEAEVKKLTASAATASESQKRLEARATASEAKLVNYAGVQALLDQIDAERAKIEERLALPAYKDFPRKDYDKLKLPAWDVEPRKALQAHLGDLKRTLTFMDGETWRKVKVVEKQVVTPQRPQGGEVVFKPN